MRPPPQGAAAEQEHESGRGDREEVEARARQSLRRGRLRRRGRGLRRPLRLSLRGRGGGRHEREDRDARGDAGPGRHDGRCYRRARMTAVSHILVLAARDWTHPQAGVTGTVLLGHVSGWIAAGRRVTVAAGDYPGAERVSPSHERLAIHRMGSRLTVFPRAAWATLRGLGPDADADVVLEVCDGIAFFTSFWRWLRKPRVLLVLHGHQARYIAELGFVGRVAAYALEHAPLRFLYPGVPVVTISQSSRDDLVGYKRIELLLDVAAAIPGATLHLAGDGEHRAALEARAAELGLDGRTVFHGHVDEPAKARLLGEARLALTASSAEGSCLTVMEAARRAPAHAASRGTTLHRAPLT
jgi:hypothetical protein